MINKHGRLGTDTGANQETESLNNYCGNVLDSWVIPVKCRIKAVCTFIVFSGRKINPYTFNIIGQCGHLKIVTLFS